MNKAFQLVLLSGLPVLSVLAAGPSPGEDAVAASARAYEAAFAKGDVPALADLFAEDVSYTSDEGRTYEGRDAIAAQLTESLTANPGAAIAIRTDSVKVLSPDVLAEKGYSSVRLKSGETSGALFTAIHVKRDGQWRISQLVETPAPELSAADHLSELAWLVGDWREADKENGLSIDSRFAWAQGGSFLIRSVTVRRASEVVLEGVQIIGWDPVAQAIRSWTFDGEGGYSEGAWTREGKRWLSREKGYTGSGNRTSAETTITREGDDRFHWESGNRTLDGVPMPGIGRIPITRLKGE